MSSDDGQVLSETRSLAGVWIDIVGSSLAARTSVHLRGRNLVVVAGSPALAHRLSLSKEDYLARAQNKGLEIDTIRIMAK